jgi:hypothetical protein
MGTHINQLSSIKDTTLWKKLNDDPTDSAKQLALNLIGICQEAANRIKQMPAYAAQYTLHDEVHLLNVTELMAKVLGDTINQLNFVEITLLILSAYYHDQGMVLDADEYRELENNDDFRIFRENWYLNHPNKQEIELHKSSAELTQDEESKLSLKLAELEIAMLTDYLRTTHAERSKKLVKKLYATDKRLEVFNVNLADLAAKLCFSHHQNAADLIPENGFEYDEQVGTVSVNLPYLAVILRLADILDFDRDRTPDILFNSIHFTSEISINEWEKHRGVYGWKITADEILFSMQFKHPVYEATARKFLGWIDNELRDCHELCLKFPAKFNIYNLQLPHAVKSRIKAADNAYIYSDDLEFSLSRNEIVKLLMTDQLYNNPSLCIRELLQNSLDALRYRKALYGCANMDWQEGKVEFKHYVDENGYEVIMCKDNGTGMDEKIVKNFFSKAGRSYYRSPEFEHERSKLRQHNKDFDPCSQFGIGFMSCFMLGDRIIIETKRDYGVGKLHGKPLIIEINGLGSLFVIKDGKANQDIGTTVKIISRKKPTFFDEWIDRVRLTTVLKGYALATEFPIYAKCSIQEIKSEVTIPPEIDPVITLLEHADISKKITIEQSFSEINSFLNGMLRESFLIDDNGLPTIENDEGKWIAHVDNNRHFWKFEKIRANSAVDKYMSYEGISVSIDGILIAGLPGRMSYRDEVRYRLGNRNSQIYTFCNGLIDIRGNIKPEITPARIPPEFTFNKPPSWERIQFFANCAEGKVIEKLSLFLEKGLKHEVFWKLAVIYDFFLPRMSFLSIWNNMAVSVINDENQEWIKISNLDKFYIDESVEKLQLITINNYKISPSELLIDWEKQGEDRPNLHWHMNVLVLLMSSFILENNELVLIPTYPEKPEDVLSQYTISDGMLGISGFIISYKRALQNTLTVESKDKTFNKNHPLCEIYMQSKFLSKKTDLQEFAASFLSCIADAIQSEKDIPNKLESPQRCLKAVAHQYFSVNWSAYDTKYKPPYKIWLKDKGFVDITEDYFKKWRDA